MGFASWQRYCTASSSGRQPNFAALNSGRHLCTAGQPSRWALAHISSFLVRLMSIKISSTVSINIISLTLTTGIYHSISHIEVQCCSIYINPSIKCQWLYLSYDFQSLLVISTPITAYYSNCAYIITPLLFDTSVTAYIYLLCANKYHLLSYLILST